MGVVHFFTNLGSPGGGGWGSRPPLQTEGGVGGSGHPLPPIALFFLPKQAWGGGSKSAFECLPRQAHGPREGVGKASLSKHLPLYLNLVPLACAILCYSTRDLCALPPSREGGRVSSAFECLPRQAGPPGGGRQGLKKNTACVFPPKDAGKRRSGKVPEIRRHALFLER